MTISDRAEGRSRRWLWPTISVAVVTGAALLTFGLIGRGSSLPPPSPSHATPTSAPTGSHHSVASTLAVASPSAPVQLVIPELGLSVALGTLGLNPDGTVQVPSTADQAGWFRLGPFPGEVGSAVILGHVDSYKGPGVFFRLRSLVPGDQVDVALATGVVAEFSVTSVTTYPKAAFPAQAVYASHGISALQLVTCGGVFDHQTGSYLSNVVVYSTLIGTTPASAAMQVAAGA
jgi:hypothetical protein